MIFMFCDIIMPNISEVTNRYLLKPVFVRFGIDIEMCMPGPLISQGCNK